jgi:hypothetical protein
VDRGQKAADEHDQQVDFHVSLRCAIAALASAMQKASSQKRRLGLCNDIGAIKNG